MQLSRVIQRIGRLAGLEIRSEAYAQRVSSMTCTSSGCLTATRITTVLDIGANVGGFRAASAQDRVSLDGSSRSSRCKKPFEKLTALAQADGKLGGAIASPSETRTETRQIHVMAGSELNSFLPPAETSTAMQVSRASPRGGADARRMAGSGLGKGLREGRYAGARPSSPAWRRRAFSSAFPLLQTEVSVRAIYQGMTRWTDALATIDALGFDITGLFPCVAR
jgi:hypothetical protein